MDTRATLQAVKPISGYQFAAFRILFGLYLCVHFIQLAFYAPDMFSRSGSLPDASLNFTFGILPNPLEYWDSPAFVTLFVASLALMSLVFALGWKRRLFALLLWYGAACLFNRNNLISNPSLAYVGMLLLLTALVPTGEPLALGDRRKEQTGSDWFFPAWVFRTAWILMAVGYSYSGLDKLLTSPSWLDGTALTHVANLPLARPGPLREALLSLPEAFRAVMTWAALSVEVLFLPLALIRRTRPFVWLLAIGMHVSIIALVSFADLSFGMLALHAFTFDPEWLPAAAPAKDGKPSKLVLYDGVCVLCNRSVQWLVDQDPQRVLHYAPLQGETAKAVLERHPNADRDLSTILYVRDYGRDTETVFERSDAALQILADLGGFFRVCSWARALPRVVRDTVYSFIARNRYRWFGKYDVCRLPEPEWAERFLN